MAELQQSFEVLTQLDDATLHGELKRTVGAANALTAELLAQLGELEARGIYRERACSSLYTYCVYELRMSEDAAQRRCRAARLARQFPVLLDMVAEASIQLTGILLLGPHLTAENHRELLARARYRTKREIERLVAMVAPRPDVQARVEPLRRAGAEGTATQLNVSDARGSRPRNTWAAFARALAGPVRQLQAGVGAGQAPPSPVGVAATPMAVTDEMWPATLPAVPERADEMRYKVQFTADQAYVDLLEEARDLLQHELPDRDLVEVQRRALQRLVEQLRRRKHAGTERPRVWKAPPTTGPVRRRPVSSRHPPAAVRRAVWQRDGGRCAYVDERGTRCRETAGLEFHHLEAHALGGPTSEPNLSLRCRAHNALAAEHDFGRQLMQRYTRAGRDDAHSSSAGRAAEAARGGPRRRGARTLDDYGGLGLGTAHSGRRQDEPPARSDQILPAAAVRSPALRRDQGGRRGLSRSQTTVGAEHDAR
jgi:5-methylcytosine-specific restriction endonuclease McrA